MVRIQDIQEALSPLVGWEQHYNPAKHIDDALTYSESGLYYQHAHPLCTIDNVSAILPDDYVEKFENWQSGKTYYIGNVCNRNGKAYVAKVTTTEDPATSNDWNAYNIVSEYLQGVTRAGIAQVVQTFLTRKQLDNETRSLLERRTFFDGSGRINATIDATHKIVGFEILPVRSMGVTTKIEKIGLQFRGTGKVKIYLFHSSQVDPVATYDLEYTKNGGFQWFAIPETFLPYISDATGAGGTWFLCYNQDELPQGMDAINVAKDWSREPCGTCNIGSVEAWRELTKYLQISPFAIHAPETFEEYPELWDVALMTYTNTRNYGLNVQISVGCDLTDFIIAQRAIFADVLQKQVAANVLRMLALNPNVRVNRNQSNASKMDILYELDGNTQGRPSGLGYEMEKAYKALNISTDGLDRICLSCNNHGVRYRSV